MPSIQPRRPWLSTLGRMQAGVFVVDARQRIVLWNDGAKRLLGHSATQVIGRPCHQVVGGACEGRPWCQPNCGVQRSLRCGALPRDVDVLTRVRSGQPIWIGFSILAVPDGDQLLAAHFMRDVTREKANEDRIASVRSALQGVCPPAAPSPPRRVDGSPARLTRRETEVLSLLSRGISSRAIADRLGISRHTVRKHVQNALDRLGLHSRVAAVAFALQSGLL